MTQWWLLTLLMPWIGAAALVLWPRHLDRLAPALALGVALVAAVSATAAQVIAPPAGPLVTVAQLEWVPHLGLALVLTRDGLSAMFALLTTWIGALVILYAWRYFPHARYEAGSERRERTFYALLLAFTGAMLGLVSAGHLLQLYACWELTGLASFLLIGFWHQDPGARAGARRSLMLTTIGSLALLGGLLLIGVGSGSWELAPLLAEPTRWQGAPWWSPAAVLVAIGALSKSAQFPFWRWLPGAMAAPAPVSAYLHSATLVAAGIYLLARFFSVLASAPGWSLVLIGAGAIGAVFAGLIALRQRAIKGLLAYSTISQYAFIVIAFGLGSVEGAQAGLYAFFIHAMIKASLFLVAGAVTHLTGETSFAGLGGLGHTHRLLALLAVASALSLGGVPAFGGFYYKEELLHAAYAHQAWALLAAMLLGGLLTFLYMMRFVYGIFFAPAAPRPRAQPLPWPMGVPIALLTGASIATGLFPNWMNPHVLNPAIASVVGRPAPYGIELHASGVLLMSLGVLAAGVAIWLLTQRGAMRWGWIDALPTRTATIERSLTRLYEAASQQLLSWQNGNLRRYLRIEIAATLALAAWCWWHQAQRGFAIAGAFDAPLAAMLGIALLAGSATVWLRSHVVAIVALTISGYSLAAAFALMHAPDVALAQVLVETLATIAIVVALRQSQLIDPPTTMMLTSGKREWRRWALALGAGVLAGAGTLWATARPTPRSLGAWYAEYGYTRSGMADLVTAILTDFRALDTAIEILVFAAAAFAVLGLYHRASARGEAP